MSVIINKNTKVIVQGITGQQGSFHTKLMKEYGTTIVAGVTPGKGGQFFEGIPVFNSVREALEKHKADFTINFVPAKFAKTAALDALDSKLNSVIITEGIPILDSIEIMKNAKEKKLAVIGPNCPSHIFKKGNIGLVSRSGTLTYEIIDQLTKNNLGQSTAIGIGGDPIIGVDFIKALELFEKDKETKKIVLIGEIGGDAEERAAEFIKKNVSKKVVAYIAGRTAPPGKRMGHAGAIISGNAGTADSKIKALENAGVKVAKLPSEVVSLLKE